MTEDKPKRVIEYVIKRKDVHYWESTDDRAEAMKLGKENGADVIAVHMILDRWGAFYDIQRKEPIMRGGVPVTPSLDDFTGGARWSHGTPWPPITAAPIVAR